VIAAESNILIADDSPGMQKVLCTLFRGAGYQNLHLASDGQMAWELIKNRKDEQRFDLIVSDFTMPLVNGLDLLRLVRSSDKFSDLPFLIVTAETKPKLLEDLHLAGVTAILNKPFTSTNLYETLHKIVGKKVA